MPLVVLAEMREEGTAVGHPLVREQLARGIISLDGVAPHHDEAI